MRSILPLSLLLAFTASPAVAQDIVSDLEAHYSFDANGADSSGNGRNANYYRVHGNGPATHVAGQVGNAMKFGDGEIYWAAAPYMAGESTYTIAFWIRVDFRADFGANPITIEAASHIHSARLKIGSNRVTPSTKVGGPMKSVRAEGRNGRVVANVEGDPVENPNWSPETDDAWQFIALCVDDGDAVLWTGTAGGSLTSKELSGDWTLRSDAGRLKVGGSSTCLVDELRIFSRSLASGDVAALFAEAD